MKVNGNIQSVEDVWQLAGKIRAVEIGSRGGAFDDLKNIASIVDYIGFEPDKNECDRLNEFSLIDSIYQSQSYYPVAIGLPKHQSLLKITRQPGCSSFLHPNTDLVSFFNRYDWFEVEKELPISLISLDDFCESEKIDCVDFLKIDVEGMELEILNSGSSALKDLLGMRIEVNFIEHRFGQTKLIDIIRFLDANGFRIFGFPETHSWRLDNNLSDSYRSYTGLPYSRGQVAHGDIICFRSPMTEYELNELDPKVAIRLAALQYAYGYLSHSNALLQSHLVQDYIESMLGAQVGPKLLISDSMKLGRSIRRARSRKKLNEFREEIRNFLLHLSQLAMSKFLRQKNE